MNILAIADVEERCLWECFRKERFEDVDLILSAGDLDPDYLEFWSLSSTNRLCTFVATTTTLRAPCTGRVHLC